MNLNTQKDLDEMKQILIDHNEYEYYDIQKTFWFAGKKYKTSVNYAYLNAKLDNIFHKYNLPHDKDWMWTINMNYGNTMKLMNKLVKNLFNLGLDKLLVDDIMLDVVNNTSHIINLFDQGSRTTVNTSFASLILACNRNKEIDDLLNGEHINDDMTPEEIYDKKKEILDRLKTTYIPGITPLLLSGTGVKADQLFNCMIGLWLRVRTKDAEEVAPVIIHERWIDGIRTKETHFIETNINRQAAIASKQSIKKAGDANKKTGILSQDIYINGENCNTVNHLDIHVTDQQVLNTLHYKYMLHGDHYHMITPEDKHLIGKTIKIRSVFMCNLREGVCEMCYGAHAKWAKPTELYNKDLGSEATKDHVSEQSQKLLSTKHNVTPDLIPTRFDIVNINTGEILEDYTQLFSRKFNELIPNKGIEAYFYAKDLLTLRTDIKDKTSHLRGSVRYVDTDFNEYDKMRVDCIYMKKGNDVYKVTSTGIKTKSNRVEKHTPLIVAGFDSFNVYNYGETIPLEGHRIFHIIPNVSKVKGFDMLQAVYNSVTRTPGGKEDKNTSYVDNITELVERAKEVLPDAHMTSIEILFKNKIKDPRNLKGKIDWSKPNPPYIIITSLKAINQLSSLSVKLGLGWFRRRLNDSFYYNPDNLTASAYDLLLDSDEEILNKSKYQDVNDDDDIDFYALYRGVSENYDY